IWIRKIVEGEPFLVFGDGLQRRDFNYVDDVTDALLAAAAAEKANGEIYNLGADDPLSLKDTARLLVDTLGRGSYEIVPFPNERKIIDIGDYYGNHDKLSMHLGWKPRVGLKDGLEKTLEYYQEYSRHYVEP
ncbi:MAG: NAD-dependent epimerase/dehydratase family protein, partial [Desulfomonilia bacterium]